MAKARLRRGIEIVKLANRIEALRIQGSQEDDDSHGDLPENAGEAAGRALAIPPSSPASVTVSKGLDTSTSSSTSDDRTADGKKGLSGLARSAIFREVVLAKVRETKEQEERERVKEEARVKSMSREGSGL